jgi:prolyl 4-hydroxylase
MATELTTRDRALRETRERIRIIPLLTEAECDRFIQAAVENVSWKPSIISQGYEDNRLDTDRRVSDSLYQPMAPELFEPVFTSIESRLKPLLWRNGKRELAPSLLHLVRYRSGGYFTAHRDALPNAPEAIAWRRFTIVCYLNDEFAGGATRFPTIDLSVKPRKGEAVLFPSWYLHAGQPVESGEKFIFNFYLGNAASGLNGGDSDARYFIS